MHDCPECGLVCACDQDDTWNDAAAEECTHECYPDGEPDDGDYIAERVAERDDAPPSPHE